MPSLAIIIKKDGREVYRRSLLTLISQYQTSTEIAVINHRFDEFENLEVQVLDGSKKHDYSCVLLYE
jgi:hypothetical protein